MDEKCPKGDILRKGYKRRGYKREGYVKNSTGQYIEPVTVKATYVPPTCIKERGNNTHRLLPKLKNDISLRKFGYKTDLPERERHVALKNAAKASDLLLVERRLNLIRNKQINPGPKAAMSSDIKYLHNLYAKEREKYGRNRRSYKLREKENNKHIGNYLIKGGKKEKTVVYENYTLNIQLRSDKMLVEFRTLYEEDLPAIEKLNEKLNENCITDIETKLNNSELIGLLIDKHLKGYVYYTVANRKIQSYCVPEKYEKILKDFVAKYFNP